MDKLKKIKPIKVAVFLPLGWGSILSAIPAVQSFKDTYPQSKITLIAFSDQKEIAYRYKKIFSAFQDFPGFTGIGSTGFNPEKFLLFLKKAQSKKYDLWFQLAGSDQIFNTISSLCQPKRVSGFYNQGEFCPDPTLYIASTEYTSETQKYTKLLHYLNIKGKKSEINLPISLKEQDSAKRLLKKFGVEKNEYSIIHIAGKDWTNRNWAKLADSVMKKGVRVILTGPYDHKQKIRDIASAMVYTPVNLTGKITIGTEAAIIKNSRAIISSDSGLVHVASSMSVPGLVIPQKQEMEVKQVISRARAIMK
jgi:ADP-heptose:LPS heptosyltransferase